MASNIQYPPNDVYVPLFEGDCIKNGDEFNLNAMQYGGENWKPVSMYDIGTCVKHENTYRRKRIPDSEFMSMYFQLNALKENVNHDSKFNETKYNVVDLLELFANRKFDISFWPGLYVLQLRKWGFNLPSAKKLAEWGSEGHNWEKLHPSEAEKEMTPEAILGRFYAEVGYCSDRMGLDRLFRCHWLYNEYLRRTRK